MNMNEKSGSSFNNNGILHKEMPLFDIGGDGVLFVICYYIIPDDCKICGLRR